MKNIILLLLCASASADVPDVKPLEPVIIDLRGSAGPPSSPSCAEALGLLVEKPKAPTGKTVASSDVVPRPDPAEMPLVTLQGNEAMNPELLPGAHPELLPVQPLEGPPEVLARIKAVFERGDAGERVRISFLGASHTGGDWWTGHIRRKLQERWGDLGHGFIMPAALYKGYRGQDLNLCRTDGWLSDWAGKANGHQDGLLGFAGMSVSSDNPNDFGWLETTHTNKQGRKVSYFDIYTLSQPEGGTLLVQLDERDPVEISTRAEIPGISRSRVLVDDGGHRLKLAPAGDGEVRIFGVSMEREGPGALVDAMGIRGRQARDWLRWEPEMAARGLASLEPDLVVLAYGTNEANDHRYTMEKYRSDLTDALVMLRRAAPEHVPCILAGPSDRGVKIKEDTFAIWDRTEPVAQVQREVAAEHGCAFWDWQQATGGPGSMIAWRYHDPKLAAGDLIHHTRAGYELVADRFLESIEAIE